VATLPDPTDENLIAFVFGDEVTRSAFRTPMTSSAADTYNEIVMNPVNGPLWERRVLPVKTTVLVNLAILATLNRPHELFARVVGLLRGGVSVQEIKEVFLHIGFYAGNPAGVEATKALYEAMQHMKEQGALFRES
jgi:4-carboxymuconolactone decarboxylase